MIDPAEWIQIRIALNDRIANFVFHKRNLTMTTAQFHLSDPFTSSEVGVEDAMRSHHDRLRKLPEVELLSHFIWGEARGEKVEGKLAIAHVVLKRVKARSYYGGAIQDVILKPGHFTCFTENDPNLAQILNLPSNCMAAAGGALLFGGELSEFTPKP
jgi:hypothetical protein